jgi:hypothetical protein
LVGSCASRFPSRIAVHGGTRYARMLPATLPPVRNPAARATYYPAVCEGAITACDRPLPRLASKASAIGYRRARKHGGKRSQGGRCFEARQAASAPWRRSCAQSGRRVGPWSPMWQRYGTSSTSHAKRRHRETMGRALRDVDVPPREREGLDVASSSPRSHHLAARGRCSTRLR